MFFSIFSLRDPKHALQYKFIEYIENNDLKSVEKMILDKAQNVDINYREHSLEKLSRHEYDSLNFSPLHFALLYQIFHANSLDMIKLLLKNGADLQALTDQDSIADLEPRNMPINSNKIRIMLNRNDNLLLEQRFHLKTNKIRKYGESTQGIAITPDIAKLLITSHPDLCGFIKGDALTNEFIAEIFLPFFILLNDNRMFLSRYTISIDNMPLMNILPEDLLVKILGDYIPLFIKQLLVSVCSITSDRASEVYSLIANMAKCATKDELNMQREFLTATYLHSKLCDVVYARIMKSFRDMDVLDSSINSKLMKEYFVSEFEKVLTPDTAKYFQIAGRLMLSEFATQIAVANREQPKFIKTDMRIIFQVLLYLATNQRDRAFIFMANNSTHLKERQGLRDMLLGFIDDAQSYSSTVCCRRRLQIS